MERIWGSLLLRTVLSCVSEGSSEPTFLVIWAMDSGPVDSPVTLVIKAPNQKYEDQTINCFLNWTVEKLKSHISSVYPSKPVSSFLSKWGYLINIIGDKSSCEIFMVSLYREHSGCHELETKSAVE